MRTRYKDMPPYGTPEYMREWRRRNAAAHEREKAKQRAKGRALWRLAHQYPDEFDALVAEELGRENLS